MSTAYNHLKEYKQGQLFTGALRDRLIKELVENGDLVPVGDRHDCTTRFMLGWDAFQLDTTSGLRYNASGIFFLYIGTLMF